MNIFSFLIRVSYGAKMLCYLIALIIFLTSSLVFGYEKKDKINTDIMTVAFLNVGQGDSIFIETPNGKQVLIDGGLGNQVLTALSEVVPFYDRDLDLLIATHNDADHVGGFIEIFNRFQVTEYADYGLQEEGNLIDELEQKIQSENLQKRFVLRAGQKIILDSENKISLEVLWPPEGYQDENRNNSSVIVRLVYGQSEFMLTGDAPIFVEDLLIGKFGQSSAANILDSDVLKAGHHGSETSTGDNFLKTVDPDYVVISAGKDNKYGHPDGVVIDRITRSGSRILETENGSVIFEADGKSLILKN